MHAYKYTRVEFCSENFSHNYQDSLKENPISCKAIFSYGRASDWKK